MPNAFVDTNVLIYAADESAEVTRKTRLARQLLRHRDLYLSVQVLNEFVVNARHPGKLNFDPQQEHEWVLRWLLFPVAPLTAATFVEALSIHARHQLSHWDSLIIAAARESRCTVIYTEDLTHGRDYDGVTAVNPFLPA
jgi:predicted nucleic acid-binding protein